MGTRKQNSALARKEVNKDVVKASLNNCSSSPRKMRLVADIIRGESVSRALYILKYSKKEASSKLEKLLLSAIANWQVKNPSADIEAADLFIKEIYVDSARQLKRLRPAPQGRGYRVRKRSNHVTLILGNKSENQ